MIKRVGKVSVGKSHSDEWDDETIAIIAEGVKDDFDKPRMDLIPPEAMFRLAAVLTFGAKKYDVRNWENGMSWGRVFAACLRHLWAWQRGDAQDDESGFSHLDHALCCVVFLVTFEARGIGRDDRRDGVTHD